ncbi:Serine/threonine-protein kinase StkP [Symmachiella dynata]|uniref:serine/threonine-protein kinase n=1 Tax=Symmachiella dynata TaxID=2527995 RepID=UPI00118AF8D5|nr:serine/threonine-protein kinase [Symmachiella dynata]QDT46326.1 Serine/threonine-protein kinase StkP [Symmachiella dynata]
MRLTSVDNLGHQLVRLEFVTQSELAACMAQLRGNGSTPEDLLRLLERKQHVTSYQVGKILRGEIDFLVQGRYTLMYRNGAGSFARVFRAKARDTGEMVGIKLLRQRYVQDPGSVAEFHREAQLGKTMKHPNIVPIYDVGRNGDHHYFSMEFIEGGNLRELMRIRKKLSVADATRSTLDMASGLEYALGRGFTHRDLKMTNVLLSSKGVAKLVDFGLAGGDLHLHHEPGESSARALEYATLEKSTGVPPNDPRSDLFFLGAIYYELLTGVPAFGRARERSDRAQVSRYRDVRPITAIDSTLPGAVVDIVNKMLQYNPKARYQTPTALISDLRSAQRELGDSSSPDVPSPPSNKQRKRRRDSEMRTVMCIEDRSKQQNDLRSYFSKHGFRVLMLNDLQRGLNRLSTAPPDCMVIMAESVGSGALEGFQEAARLRNGSPMVTVLVLPENQADQKAEIDITPTEQVLVQPVTLRELRTCIKTGLDAASSNGKSGPERN